MNKRKPVKDYEVGITFKPKPKVPFTVPCPCRVHGNRVGMLIHYDHATGTGVASLRGNLRAEELVCMTVAEYDYERLEVVARRATK